MFTQMFQPHRNFQRLNNGVVARHERLPNQDDGSGDDDHVVEGGDVESDNNNSSNANGDISGGVNDANSNNANNDDGRQQDAREPTVVAIGGDNGIVLIRGNQQQQLQQNVNGSIGSGSSRVNDSNNNRNTNESPLRPFGGNINESTQSTPSGTHDTAPSSSATSVNNANNINGANSVNNVGSNTNNNVASHNDDDEEEGVLQPHPTTHPFLSDQIQTERELRYRRQSTCTLIILFFLVRLWIEAILEKDVALIFIAIMGTTWTYRWMVARREYNEEYDRQMEEHTRSRASGASAGEEMSGTGVSVGRDSNGRASGADAVMNFDPDLGLMSFQAQLALAILESQRQMFENGGYGGNDRSDVHSGPGVTNEAKKRWKRYEWGDEETGSTMVAGGSPKDGNISRPCSSTTIHQRVGSTGSNYGSVSTAPTEDENDEEMSLERSERSVSKLKEEGLDLFGDEIPSCSICLCEYELGEGVTRLPCGHIYHDSCIDSWTSNHVRCPLCLMDLMEGYEQPASQQQQTTGSSIGRRRGSRRSAGSGRRRIHNAIALAAMEDSVV